MLMPNRYNSSEGGVMCWPVGPGVGLRRSGLPVKGRSASPTRAGSGFGACGSLFTGAFLSSVMLTAMIRRAWTQGSEDPRCTNWVTFQDGLKIAIRYRLPIHLLKTIIISNFLKCEIVYHCYYQALHYASMQDFSDYWAIFWFTSYYFVIFF